MTSRAGRSRDPLRIIERAYEAAPDESWLDGIATAALPFAVGGGVIAGVVRREAGVTLERLVVAGDVPSTAVDGVRRFCELVGESSAAQVFAPTEIVGNAGHRLLRLEQRAARNALPPSWALIGGNPAARSVFVLFPSARAARPEERFPHREKKTLGLVAAHLGAALRLRALVGCTSSADDPSTEAVLSSEGKVLHATGAAQTPGARHALIDAVARARRARGRMRTLDPAQAAQMWTALVEGQWSIVDTTSSDGKRLVLARKNALTQPDIIGLTREESDVVWLAAAGHSFKYLAYELGIAVLAVHRRLRSALKKLRITSRRELILRLGTSNEERS